MLPTLGKTFRPVRLKNLAAEEKSTDFIQFSLILIKFEKNTLRKRAKIFHQWPNFLANLAGLS
jgi:hypothetical protein